MEHGNDMALLSDIQGHVDQPSCMFMCWNRKESGECIYHYELMYDHVFHLSIWMSLYEACTGDHVGSLVLDQRWGRADI